MDFELLVSVNDRDRPNLSTAHQVMTVHSSFPPQQFRFLQIARANASRTGNSRHFERTFLFPCPGLL